MQMTFDSSASATSWSSPTKLRALHRNGDVPNQLIINTKTEFGHADTYSLLSGHFIKMRFFVTVTATKELYFNQIKIRKPEWK